MKIISYRRAATGVWGYRFYTDSRLLGMVSCIVAPNSPVRIEGEGISWYSTFNMDTTVVPGISRHIKDEMGADAFRIIYCEPGFYRINKSSSASSSPLSASVIEGNGTGGMAGHSMIEKSLLVEHRNGMYLFGEQGMPVMAMTERVASSQATAEHTVEKKTERQMGVEMMPDTEPYFVTTVFEERVEMELLMMILAFPALRFY